MDSKYCSSCLQKRLLSCFSATSTGKVLSTCNSCRTKGNKKRKALQELDPNLPSKRHVTRPKTTTITPGTPQLRPNPPSLLEPRPVAPSIPQLRPNPPSLLRPHPIAPGVPQLPPNPPRILKPHPIAPSVAQLRPNPPGLLELRPTTPSCLESRSIPSNILESRPTRPPQILQPLIPCENGFLSAEQWGHIQTFNRKMANIKMETCIRCKETWFLMELKDNVCHDCTRRDKGNKTPFLMSGENSMDPGELPAYLPELTQVEEMIIARCHIQMMVYRYRGHQYHYSGHCVSFTQNIAKTVDILPNLPSELDIVVLRPSNQVMEGEQRYQRQSRSTFQVQFSTKCLRTRRKMLTASSGYLVEDSM
jgi:hypothetical protein